MSLEALREPPEALERRLRERLRPLDGEAPAAGGSDHDLNPDMPRAAADLVDAAVLVPLVLRPGGVTALLTRRTDTLTKHAGQVAFPGGRCDPGETAVETALREAEEEVALPRDRVRPVALGEPYVTGTGFRMAPVLALVREGWTPRPSPAEVAEVFEVPWPWLMDPANAAVGSRAWAGGERRFHVLEWEGRTIWGATAGVLVGLRRRLYGD